MTRRPQALDRSRYGMPPRLCVVCRGSVPDTAVPDCNFCGSGPLCDDCLSDHICVSENDER